MKIIALCLVLALSGCALSKGGKLLDVGVAAAGIADVVTTQQAIAQGRGREGNGLMSDRLWQQGVIKAFGVSTVIAGAWLLEQKSHPVIAHVIRSAAMIGWSAVAIHNGRVR